MGKKWLGLGLTGWILVGLAAGLLAGLLGAWWLPAALNDGLVRWVYDPLGKLFLNGIRLLVVPLVLVSLTLGTASIGDVRRLGRIGGKALALYLGTTAAAISLGYGLALLIRPGSGLSIPLEGEFEGRTSPFLMDLLVDIVPTNPVQAMVEGKMLQVVFLALLAGLSLAAVGEAGAPVKRLLASADAVIQRMVWMVMLLAPLGVFALLAKVVVSQGVEVFLPLVKYMVTILLALALHAGLTYSGLLLALTRLSPLRFYRNAWPALLVAFSTSSSNATLPVTLRTSQERMGTDESVHAFTLPLGATINMDGTAIMQGVATVFIAQVYGVPLTGGDFLLVVLMATLASIGTAGVPGVGLIMLSMVLDEIGLPIEGIGIILGVDRVLDMCRTAVNVGGDLMTTVVVARSEGKLDEARFCHEDPSA